MNKVLKIIISLLLVLTLLAAGTYCVLRFSFGIDLFDRSGWTTSEDGYVQYLDYHGDPLTGWQLIDGKWYYLDPDYEGILVTGWLEQNGCRYYLDTDGTRYGGWLNLPEGTYYLSPTSGIAATGWFHDGTDTYYMDDSGRMLTGWVDVAEQRYYLEGSGTLVTGWLELDEGRYYLDTESGAMHRGWLETELGRQYLDETTGILVTGWLETEEGRLYLDENGRLSTGWTETPEGTYYFGEDGYPLTGWLETDTDCYYLDENGQMTLGWLTLEDVTYYFREDGTMAVGKVIIEDTARYFTSTGAYVVLVNRWNPVPEDYTSDLVYFGEWRVDSSCYDALVQMLEDCPYSYTITSAYRSKATQQYIWDKRMNNYQASGYSYSEALAMVEAYVAVPGTSEHQLGLAIDISGSDAVCGWLEEHCWEYGFLLRYPAGKEAITGINYERWHFRYVGTELSLELRDLGLTMEEYMDMLTEQAGSDAGTASNPELFPVTEADNAA